jgi:hypothetical protein
MAGHSFASPDDLPAPAGYSHVVSIQKSNGFRVFLRTTVRFCALLRRDRSRGWMQQSAEDWLAQPHCGRYRLNAESGPTAVSS